MAPRKKSVEAAAESTAAKEVTAKEEKAAEEKAAEGKTTAKTAKSKKTEEKKAAEKKPAEKKKAEPKPSPKAIGTKKDTTKALETKAGVLVGDVSEQEEPKPTAKKTAEKTVEKKPAAKKLSSRGDVKTEMFLQFDGKEYTEKDIFQKVKEVWTKVLKNKVGDMKDVKIYLKPEESAAYYVINEDTSGKIEL